MRKRIVLGSIVGLLALLVMAEAALAQVRIGTGGRGGTSVGVYTPAFSFQSGRPYYNDRYYYGDRYSSPYYGGRYYDSYYSSPYYGGSSYSRSYQSYYSAPSYYYSSPRYYDSAGYGPATTGGYQASYPQADNRGVVVHLRVTVPHPDARVWVSETQTQQRGTNRLFVSPPLERGKTFHYTLRASWMENGKEVKRERTVPVQAGQEIAVDFSSEQIDRPGNAPIREDARGEKTHEGVVVRAGEGKLTMTGRNGQDRHTHMIPAGAKVMCDGKDCRLDDLREGFYVLVTIREDRVIRLEATSSN